jgi:hypothetical protein
MQGLFWKKRTDFVAFPGLEFGEWCVNKSQPAARRNAPTLPSL